VLGDLPLNFLIEFVHQVLLPPDGALTGYVYIDLNSKDYGGFARAAYDLFRQKLLLPHFARFFPKQMPAVDIEGFPKLCHVFRLNHRSVVCRLDQVDSIVKTANGL
jgi:hypothetical protein